MKNVSHMSVPCTLTEKQFHRLKQGHIIQLKPEQISLDTNHRHHIVIHHAEAKRILKAARSRKGARVSLTPEEFEMSGEGIKEFWEKLKSGASWLKKNIIDSDVYKSAVKPIVSQAVKTGFAAATPFLGAASPLAEQAVRAIGEKSGIYGSGRRGRGVRAGHIPMQYGHGDNGADVSMSAREIGNLLPASEFRPIVSPSKYPSIIQYQERLSGRPPRGGSFRLN